MGYHGTFQETYDKVVLAGEQMNPGGVKPTEIPAGKWKEQTLWLGPGVYFWFESEDHAWRWAGQIVSRYEKEHPGETKEPAVIPAEITLGNCLDLMQSDCHKEVYAAYLQFRQWHEEYMQKLPPKKRKPFPRNRARKNPEADNFHPGEADGAIHIENVFRPLDFLVFETLHRMREIRKDQQYDTVLAAFQEGKPLYPGACIGTEDHVQIAVRNPKCIRVLRP